MLFNSFQFLVFFPIVLLIYYIIPVKVKKIWLLLCSYYFYMSWNPEYIFLLLGSTLVTYFVGLLIEKYREKKHYARAILIGGVVVNLGVLFFFKYFSFATSLFTSFLGLCGMEVTIPSFDILLPVGISFFTFQALGYTIDVYRKDIYAEKNFLNYALFVSFFPQLVAGPIERSKNLLKQLSSERKFSIDDFREGIYLMLWGFFLKIVLADKIAVIVDCVYDAPEQYPGCYIVIATILFAFQIYCDFGAYSIIAMGTAKTLGIKLMENFNAPYMATSVADFWKRWHISLTSWFRDYVYIPLGGNRKGKVRKNINKMIVFLLSGLWHGASLSFVVWGGLNGLYQVIGELLTPLKKKLLLLLRINENSFGSKLVKGIVTFILIDFSWVFFRANSLGAAFEVIKQMVSVDNHWVIFDGSLTSCGLNGRNICVLVLALVVLLISDFLKSKKLEIRFFIMKQDWWFRIVVLTILVLLIIVLGEWGNISGDNSFIYFQF